MNLTDVNKLFNGKYKNIREGTLVRLKSGGPIMTVEKVYYIPNQDKPEDPLVADCICFYGNQFVKQTIRLVALKEVPLKAFD